MVARVVVVRELVAAVVFLFFLALFRPDPIASNPSDLSVVNDTSPDLSTAALLIVKSLLDDPARFHALVNEMYIHDARAASYNDDDFDFPTIPSLAMAIDPTVVLDVPLAHATVFVPPRHRPSTRFMDRVLAAQVGPPTSTSPLKLPVSVITAPPPSSRPRPYPLLSPAINLDTLFVALALVAVSLLASLVYLRKLSRKPKASSPSPLPAIPSATKPAVSVPSARQAIENLVRQQNAQRQKNCLPHTTLVSIVPATQRLAVPAPVIPAAPPSPQTNTDVIYETNGGVIYETPRCRPSATTKTPASVPHRPSTRPTPGAILYETPAPRSVASLAANSIIYQTAPHSSLSSNAPALSRTSTRPIPCQMPDPRSGASLASNAIIYQTTRPSPLSSNAPAKTQTSTNPLIIYQTSTAPLHSTSSRAPPIPHHPRPSSDVIYSTYNSTGSWASYQSRAPAPSPSVRYPTHNIGTIPLRQYEVFAARLPHTPTSNGRFPTASYRAPPTHLYPQEVAVGPQYHYRDLSPQRERPYTLRVGEAHGMGCR
ncbi:hypothetical protein C8R46DRAFT_1189161 [Mycena filopes]|nr:hypothetical protein C8R46DRAFT_1189161 [Mycena filopes]